MEKYRRFADARSPEQFLTRIQKELNGRLSHLREALVPCRTENTAVIVNRIAPYLVPDPVFRALEQKFPRLLDQYTIPDPTCYLSLIQYEKYSPAQFEQGFWKLAAAPFARYGYNLLPAIHQLETDVEQQLQAIQTELDGLLAQSIQTHIVAPVQALLPILCTRLAQDHTYILKITITTNSHREPPVA